METGWGLEGCWVEVGWLEGGCWLEGALAGGCFGGVLAGWLVRRVFWGAGGGGCWLEAVGWRGLAGGNRLGVGGGAGWGVG